MSRQGVCCVLAWAQIVCVDMSLLPTSSPPLFPHEADVSRAGFKWPVSIWLIQARRVASIQDASAFTSPTPPRLPSPQPPGPPHRLICKAHYPWWFRVPLQPAKSGEPPIPPPSLQMASAGGEPPTTPSGVQQPAYLCPRSSHRPYQHHSAVARSGAQCSAVVQQANLEPVKLHFVLYPLPMYRSTSNDEGYPSILAHPVSTMGTPIIFTPWNTIWYLCLRRSKLGLNNPATVGEHYYLFAPKDGPVFGPPEGISIARPHRCFSLRFLDPLDPETPTRYFDDCEIEISTSSTPALPAALTPPRREVRAVRRPSKLEGDAALDSDEEASHLEQAIGHSMLQQPSSDTVAGPSRRPLSCRTRQRIHSPIDLTRGESPSNEVPRPTFRTVTGWRVSIERGLGSHTSTIRAPMVALGIPAILAHILSFFGGEPYTPATPEQSVEISPPGPFGLLGTSESWSMAGSVGPGVCKNTMTELMNLVFSDKVWKRVGTTFDLDLLPSGVIPDAARLQRLKAYGYTIMLHIVLCQSLPVSISTVFAYALLQPDGDEEVLKDMMFIRASAPERAQILQKWPTTPEEFAQLNRDPILRSLTADFFDKQPEEFADLSLEMLQGFGENFHRQVLFGSPTRFRSSSEIGALREGINRRIGDSSSMTLAELFPELQGITKVPHSKDGVWTSRIARGAH
ncbi:hypothetical protein DFH07DRAFT_778413 [Mycena maculata]|uniref:Uncharacterized protein n=1 Tax=Mycena maculata TaxID=230809 RepID=A0AAD7ID97_9AGAR|nr:hypothetical protein DFH07DRAFT_778413 [Mycena maculata]